MIDAEQFVSLAGTLVHGLLREAVGYSVERAIPYYRGIVGYVVEAPMLWIRHSRFPILFIAYDQRRPQILEDVVKQLEIGQATEYFSLLVVVPTRDGTGNEAEELRHIVADSVYRHDFVVLDRQHLASIIAQSSAQRLVEIVLEQGIELSSLSPYVTKGPVPENMFFGREREIKAITQTIQNSNYALVGGRQIGKSSILLKLARLLERDPRYRALYINCEDKFDYDDLFQSLPDEMQLSADRRERLAFRQIVHHLHGGAPATRLVFLLDEVDELLAFDVLPENRMQLFKSFRSLSHEGACRFVFSGGRTLYGHLHDSQSPFFNFCQELALGPLLPKSVAEIVIKPMHQLGIELPGEDRFVARLIEVSSCHPNLVQWLCDRLVRGAVTRRITLDDLESCASAPDFQEYLVEIAWGAANSLERAISLMVPAPTFSLDQLLDALRGHGIQDRARVEGALRMLQVQAFLERRGATYYLTHAGFPRIVRQRFDVAAMIEYYLREARA